MQVKDITFYSGPNAKMAGRMYLPDAKTDRRVGIVFCHGFGGNKEGTPLGLSTLLAEYGYTILTFDYRGFGGSDGPRGRLNPAEQIEDAVHALACLSTQHGLDPRRIGIYGTSFGGGVAVAAAHQSGLAHAVIVSVPVTHGGDWLRSIMRWSEYNELRARAMRAIARKAANAEIEMVERFNIMVPDPHTSNRYKDPVPVAIETFYHVLQHAPVDQADQMTVPVCVIGAKDDLLVPVEQAIRLHDRLRGPKELHLFETGGHFCVYDENLHFVADRAKAWYGTHLEGK